MRTARMAFAACVCLGAGAATGGAAPAASTAAGSAPVAAPVAVSGSTAVGFAAAASPAASAACGRSGSPLYGVVRAAGGRILAPVGRRTLRARPSPRIPLPTGVYGVSWAFSPSCDAVALGGYDGRVLLVDLERGRRTGTLELGGRSIASQVAWPRPDRLIALAGPFDARRAVTVAVPGGRVLASRSIGGRPWVTEATPLGIVALSGPGDGIGGATLALADPDGGLLRARLARIRVGLDEMGPRRLARQIVPGLAVDPNAGRAYVVAANEPLVGEVDLLSGAVTYHEVRSAGRVAARAMAAKGLAHAALRTARWLGDGTIAVSGELTRTRPDRRRAARRLRTVTRTDPYGLRLIRTSDWTAATLDPLFKSFTLTGDLLLGMNGEPASLDGADATGLVAYGTDGRRRFARFRGAGRAWLRDVAWPYAYVREISPRRTLVVDLRNGRTVGETGSRRPPVLLVP